MPGPTRDQRFTCECGAEIVYTAECPRNYEHDPRCVCGRTFAPAS